jgi:excisionase family DNA binding protein
MARRIRANRLTAAGLAIRRTQREIAGAEGRMRLRRAEALLRAELAGAVPKSVAARLLGVSTTALERWIDAGKLPAIRRPGGREEVAAEALLDLAEEVSRLREEGVPRGLLATALRRLEERGLPRRRLRPNEPASELRAAYERSTPAERIRETAELSLAATTLAAYGARTRAAAANGA